jgi:hypothetical protein
MGGGRCSPERELASVPVRGTSPWWHGEEEKGTGIPTLIGTRRRRGSDSWASAAERARQKGAQGMEVRGGGEQQARCGEAETRAPFIGVGRGDGWRGGGGALSRGGQLWKRRLGD